MSELHAVWMTLALEQARLGALAGEVPVGAVVVKDGTVIGRGHNRNVSDHDPSAHAEIIALRDAAKTLGNHRLEGCTLYVTLEPCAMCAGAICHARIQHLVFGATDPKAGAAGSVTDLFALPSLNHHTQVTAGVQADEAATLLQDFFRARRIAAQKSRIPLREDALRTPDECFVGLPGYPWEPHYIQNLPSLDGLRMHYLDEGPKDAEQVFLCLHGNPAWSYLYRKMIPVWLAKGARVIAPDMVGFGRSDKPKDVRFHQFSTHRQILHELVESLDLNNIVLVVQDWGGILGLTLPLLAPHRYRNLLVMNTLLADASTPLPRGFIDWRAMCRARPDFDIARLFSRGNPQLSAAECAAYSAPFPDTGHRAALRAFPEMVPDRAHAPGADLSAAARAFWRDEWTGSALMAVGIQDPVLGLEVMQQLHRDIKGCEPLLEVREAGHFVPEWGADLAETAWEVFAG